MKKTIISLLAISFIITVFYTHQSFFSAGFNKFNNIVSQFKDKVGAASYYPYSSNGYFISSYNKDNTYTKPSSDDQTFIDEIDDTDDSTPSTLIDNKKPSTLCESLSTNTEGDDKVNILFIPNTDDENDFSIYKNKLSDQVEVFYNTEPYKSNRKILNFYFLKNKEIIYKNDSIYFDQILKSKLAKLAQDNCTYKITQYIVVVNKPMQVSAMAGEGVATTTIAYDDAFATLHEFGHSFAGLVDTYFPFVRNDGTNNLANLEGPNVDLKGGCSGWCQSNTGPYKDACNQITDEKTCKMFNRIPNQYGGDCRSMETCCVWLNDNAVDPFFNSRCVDLVGTRNIGLSCLPNTGCYYGAYYSGEWRSTEGFDTIMSGGGTEYDPVSTRAIDLKIKCCYPQEGEEFPKECKNYADKYSAFYGCNKPQTSEEEDPKPKLQIYNKSIIPIPPFIYKVVNYFAD